MSRETERDQDHLVWLGWLVGVLMGAVFTAVVAALAAPGQPTRWVDPDIEMVCYAQPGTERAASCWRIDP